jgi:PEP-CTERM motif
MNSYCKVVVGGLLWLAFNLTAFGDILYITGYTQDVIDGGQFSANLGDPNQSFFIYCVDYRNDDGSAAVNLSSPDSSLPYGGLANTRYGTTPTANFAFYNSGPNALSAFDRYVIAGWLTTQYDFSSGVTTSDDQIQNAIWTLLNTSGTSAMPFWDQEGTGTWIEQAESWESNAEAAGTLAAFGKTVVIYTSTDVAGNNDLTQDAASRYGVGTQEMIDPQATVPEPSSVVLMGTALVAIAWFRRRFRVDSVVTMK